MKAQPYLFFDGRCDAALAFYRKAVGAEVTMLMRFGEAPDPPPPGMLPPGSEKKVMHSEMRIGDTVVFASDGDCGNKAAFQGFSVALSVATEAEARRAFGALAAGGRVNMPLGKTFFSPSFGMLSDRFGVNWMVMAEPKGGAA